MIDKPELKPCPFCGGLAAETRPRDVHCADADCAGFKMRLCSLDLWNRRADLARPKVKPLVWSDEETDKDTGMVTYVGHGAAKTYYIYDWRSVPGWGRNYFESVGTHNSLEAAKAAAQADYECRILKALE